MQYSSGVLGLAAAAEFLQQLKEERKMSPPTPPPQTLLSGPWECAPRGTENWLVITVENKKDAIRRWLLNTLFALQGPNVGDEAWETGLRLLSACAVGARGGGGGEETSVTCLTRLVHI